MVPKAGDIVDINPLFKRAHFKKYSYKNTQFGEKSDGHIHILSIMESSNNSRTIILDKENGAKGSYRIDNNGFPTDFADFVKYGFPVGGSLFVPLEIINSSIAPKNNDGLGTCFWCHIPTEKHGGGIYNVCPKCGR